MRRRIRKVNPNRPEATLDPRYKVWRSAVRKRDKHHCRWPGCKCRKNLHTHHIRKWADYILLRYEVSNGITLCKEHHLIVGRDEAAYAPTLILITAQKA